MPTYARKCDLDTVLDPRRVPKSALGTWARTGAENFQGCMLASLDGFWIDLYDFGRYSDVFNLILELIVHDR